MLQSFYIETGIILLNILTNISLLAVYGILLWALLFKTDWIISKLHLDRHFREEHFALNLHRSSVIQASVIIISVLMLAESLPDLIRQVFVFYQTREIFRENASTQWIIYHFVHAAISFTMMVNSRGITAWIEKERRKKKA
ncbi:MAG TPA: hypothetical protein VI731_05610 [Bacteroidia bacterium]|nr:hypothetical protein [Bacteroidia bacterium]